MTFVPGVIADTKSGRADRTVVVGAHLDSVAEGPGLNDNGSDSATILEIALQMSKLRIHSRNKVRFAFWGAEESGLIGSPSSISVIRQKRGHVGSEAPLPGSRAMLFYLVHNQATSWGMDRCSS